MTDICLLFLCFFFFNDTATTEIYTLSLHDALPISLRCRAACTPWKRVLPSAWWRSEEHTSELQSRFGISYAVFCLKKKKTEEQSRTFVRKALRRAPGLQASAR